MADRLRHNLYDQEGRMAFVIKQDRLAYGAECKQMKSQAVFNALEMI